MNRKTQIGLIVGIILFMFFMVWLFSAPEEQPEGTNKNLRKPYVSSNWNVRFQVNDKNPLGLYLFTSLTKAHLDTSKRLTTIDDTYALDSIVELEKKKTYLFVGNNFGLDSHEMDSILADVKRGSLLFLSFNDLTENLYPRLFENFTYRIDYGKEVNVFMNGHKFNMINIFQNDTVACDWWAFGDLEFEEPHVEVSSFMELPNFVKVKCGDGYVFLHASPNMFFNYQLKRKPGFQYTASVLNELPHDQDIFLLELGRLKDDYGSENTNIKEGNGGKKDDSYLKELLKDPMLRTAMLLALLGMLLFVIFRSKRKQPVVPYLAKRKDMTLAFAETITSIYFAKRNAYGLLQVQKKNFYDAMHRHFFVDLYKRDGDKEMQVLAEKTNTPIEEIRYFVELFETKQASGITDQLVADTAKKKYNFYKRVGIISDKIAEKVEVREMIFRRGMLLPAIMLLGGLGIIISGFYFLTASQGIGIAQVPIGIVLLILGSIRLSKPCLVITKEKMTHYSTLGFKREYLRDDLMSTDLRKGGVIFTFSNNKKLIINFWDLSRFDRKQFERLVSKLHTLEL